MFLRGTIALSRWSTVANSRGLSAVLQRESAQAPSYLNTPVDKIVENPPGRMSFISDMKREVGTYEV